MQDDDGNEEDVKEEGEEEADEDDEVNRRPSLLHKVDPWQLAPSLVCHGFLGEGGNSMVQICTAGPQVTLGRECHGQESFFSDTSKLR